MKCVVATCGNSFIDLEKGEECDDGNTISGDGCSKECKIEENYQCNFSVELGRVDCTCGPTNIEALITNNHLVITFLDPTSLLVNDIKITDLVYRKTLDCQDIFEQRGFFYQLDQHCFIYHDRNNMKFNLTGIVKYKSNISTD